MDFGLVNARVECVQYSVLPDPRDQDMRISLCIQKQVTGDCSLFGKITNVETGRVELTSLFHDWLKVFMFLGMHFAAVYSEVEK